MEPIFLGVFIVGFVLATIMVIFAEAMNQLFHIPDLDFISPVTVIGWLMTFGGAGYLMERFFVVPMILELAIAVSISTILSTILHFLTVKSMEKAENSTALSIKSLIGRTGTVLIPIPENGFGEIMVRNGAFNSFHGAKSENNVLIDKNAVIEIIKIENNILFVTQKEE